jgi:hypothetical protein
MSEHLGAASYERAEGSTGRRNGHKPRTSRFRVPTLNLLVPRTGREPSPPGSSPVTRGMRRCVRGRPLPEGQGRRTGGGARGF